MIAHSTFDRRQQQPKKKLPDYEAACDLLYEAVDLLQRDAALSGDSKHHVESAEMEIVSAMFRLKRASLGIPWREVAAT